MSTQPQLQPQMAPVQHPYDMTTPGEPAGYRIPAQYRRPLGEFPRDKRGAGWFYAFASVTSLILTIFMPLTGLSGIFGLTAIPSVAAVVLGIVALVKLGRYPQTIYAGKTKVCAWVGIIGGVLGTLIALSLAVLFITIDF